MNMLSLYLLVGFTFVIGKAQSHEIVYPRMIVSRSGEKRVLFRAFDKDFHLRLEPADALTDDLVLLTRDDKGEEVYFKPNVDHLRETVLQDPNAGATISIDDDGPLRIKGVINEKLRIEPAPSGHYKGGHKGRGHYGGGYYGHGGGGKKGNRGKGKRGHQIDEFIEEKRQEGEEDPTEQIPHIVYESTPANNSRFYNDEVIPEELKYILSNETTTEKRGGAIVVETAVVSDIRHSSRFKTDEDCIIYHLILINGVNLRFKTLKDNNVRFALVAVVRNVLKSDQPYIESNTVDGHAMSVETLYAFCTFVSNHPLLKKADLCELVTAQPLGDVDDKGVVSPGVVGIAFVGGSCSSKYKCGISEDDGFTFSGVDTFAHECGHSLSCPHDGESLSLRGSPGSKECPWDWGMIMSYIRKDEKQFAFSQCCDKCISHFSTLYSSRCLFRNDVPSNIKSTVTKLPGDYLNEIFECTTSSCFYDNKCKLKNINWRIYKVFDNKCVDSYFCRTPTNSDNYFYYYTFNSGDGEPCGENKVCKNGYCVAG